MNKKILSLGLCFIMSIGLLGCNSQNVEEEKKIVITEKGSDDNFKRVDLIYYSSR